MTDILRPGGRGVVMLAPLPGQTNYRQKGVLRLERRPQMRGGHRRGACIMAESMRAAALALLESQEGDRLIDFKLFRGDAEIIAEEDIWRQIHSALLQEKRGAAMVTDRMTDPSAPVNVRELLLSI